MTAFLGTEIGATLNTDLLHEFGCFDLILPCIIEVNKQSAVCVFFFTFLTDTNTKPYL